MVLLNFVIANIITQIKNLGSVDSWGRYIEAFYT
jgi:hypothetical protein